jgi:rhodanese-related sulfurtransferase
MKSILVALFLAAASPATAPVPAVDSADLAALLSRDPNLLLLDLRPAAAYEDGHLPLAVSIPWGEEKAAAKMEALLKTDPRPIILYGADALTLSEAAGKAAGLNGGPVSIYPAGVGGWRSYEDGFLEIEWPGLWRMLTTGSPVLLDVRDAAQFGAGHIPGARHFAPEAVSEKTLTQSPWAPMLNSGNSWITYCSGELCGESRKLARLLMKAGAKTVYQFPGGYPEWVERTACLPK